MSANAARKKKEQTKRVVHSEVKRKSKPTIPPKEESFLAKKEISIIFSISCSFFLLLSNLGLFGILGEWLRFMMAALFGPIGFFFPLYLFICTCFYFSHTNAKKAYHKIILASCVLLFFCGIYQLMGQDSSIRYSFFHYQQVKESGNNVAGILGTVMLTICLPIFGWWGSLLVLFILLVVSLVLLTEKSLVHYVSTRSTKVYHQVKKDVHNYKEKAQVRKKERQVYRRDREVKGISHLSERKNIGQDQTNFSTMYPKIQSSSASPSDRLGVHHVAKKYRDVKPPRPIFFQLDPENTDEQETYSKSEQIDFSNRLENTEQQGQNRVEDLSYETMFPDTNLAQGENIDVGESEQTEQGVNFSKDATDMETLLEQAISEIPVRTLDSALSTQEEMVPLRAEEMLENASAPVSMTWEEELDHFEELLEETDLRREERETFYFTNNSPTITVSPPPIFQRERKEESSLKEGEIRFAKTSSLENKDSVADEEDNRFFTSTHELEELVLSSFSSIEDMQEEALIKKEQSTLQQEELSGTKKQGIKETEPTQKKLSGFLSPKKEYHFPNINLLKESKKKNFGMTDIQLREIARKLQKTLQSFGVGVRVTEISCGPSVTRYELQPEQGVKVSRIVSLADDIKLNLAATDIRIEAPIPGKSAVGIEVPNKENQLVRFRDLLESLDYQKHKSPLAFAVGKDIAGQIIVADIAKMPHLLIAGATGSGKSVCINTLIMSILYKAKPDEVKLIMIDPKVVELSVYNGIPHLLIPVVTDPKKASGALHWAVAEMSSRYQKFAEAQVRDLKGYNAFCQKEKRQEEILPQIVIIVDELADLMMVAPGEVEDAICRLAQLARAAGIHLVIATQRPSVNVITGLIKANIPSRIAFAVSSGVDSRTIIDMHGAEKLLGKGDMLFYPSGYQKPQRVQGAFVSDTEVNKIVDFLKSQEESPIFDESLEEKLAQMEQNTEEEDVQDRDSYFLDAGRLILERDKASIGMLQRNFKIGFNRAARIMDQLAREGVVGEEEGSKPRKILLNREEFSRRFEA
ncbi:hypothetical protein FACS189418_0530 [Clostridia bacterium]|nr:hypothetical protein FACS189418_0530 [Clostridia bacterium]